MREELNPGTLEERAVAKCLVEHLRQPNMHSIAWLLSMLEQGLYEPKSRRAWVEALVSPDALLLRGSVASLAVGLKEVLGEAQMILAASVDPVCPSCAEPVMEHEGKRFCDCGWSEGAP